MTRIKDLTPDNCVVMPSKRPEMLPPSPLIRLTISEGEMITIILIIIIIIGSYIALYYTPI